MEDTGIYRSRERYKIQRERSSDLEIERDRYRDKGR